MFKRIVSRLLTAFIAVTASAGITATALAGDANPTPPPEYRLVISAAASLKDVVQEAGRRFEQHHPNCKVHYNFSNSAQLSSQIEQGAPVDIFASADMADVQRLADKRLIADRAVLARNALAVIVSKQAAGRIRTLQDLAGPNIRLVLAAPRVPIARYARQFLGNADRAGTYGPDYSTRVLKNLVSEEPDVRMIVTKVALGEGDAGIVYISDVTKDVRDKLGTIEIPKKLNVVANYGVGIVRNSPNPNAAVHMYEMLRSKEFAEICIKHRFLPPQS